MEGSNVPYHLHNLLQQQQRYYRVDTGVEFEDRQKDCPIVIRHFQSSTRRGSATNTKQLHESIVSLMTVASTPESTLNMPNIGYTLQWIE